MQGWQEYLQSCSGCCSNANSTGTTRNSGFHLPPSVVRLSYTSPSQFVQHVCYCTAVTPSPTPHNDNDASISQRKHPQDNKRSLLLQTMPWAALTILGFVKVASTMCLAGRVVGLGPGATNADSCGSYKLGRASNSSCMGVHGRGAHLIKRRSKFRCIPDCIFGLRRIPRAVCVGALVGMHGH